MLIRYTDGTIRVGILLSLAGSTMRVAVRDEDDVAEFRLVSGRWISEDCEPVTFEFPLAAFQAAGIVPENAEPEIPASAPVEDCGVRPEIRHLN
jgi:hypothetical protein